MRNYTGQDRRKEERENMKESKKKKGRGREINEEGGREGKLDEEV
jgi:hypothetical protein